MSVPPELAWLVPIVAPFLTGLLVGAIIKRGLKLILAVVALVLVLCATGYLSFSFKDLWDKAMEFLPRLYESGKGYLDALPYSLPTFLIGLAIGLWKG